MRAGFKVLRGPLTLKPDGPLFQDPEISGTQTLRGLGNPKLNHPKPTLSSSHLSPNEIRGQGPKIREPGQNIREQGPKPKNAPCHGIEVRGKSPKIRGQGPKIRGKGPALF